MPKHHTLDNQNADAVFNMKFDAARDDKPCYFEVKDRDNTHLIFDDSLSKNTIIIGVRSSRNLVLDGIFLKEVTKGSIVLNILDNSSVNIVFCEASYLPFEINLEVNLLGESASIDIKMACIGLENSKKVFNLFVNHKARHTTSNIDLKGVAKDSSSIKFLPVSNIELNTPNCEAHQDSRIISLSDQSVGTILPILTISNNEVVASHSACLGSIKDDEIFYLLSRGIPKGKAAALIVKGIINNAFNSLIDTEEKQKFKIVYERGIENGNI